MVVRASFGPFSLMCTLPPCYLYTRYLWYDDFYKKANENHANGYRHVVGIQRYRLLMLCSVFHYVKRVLSSPLLSVLRVSTAACCCCSPGLVRVGLKSPLDGNPANMHAHVAVVREHVWRTLCSVCATGARVAQSFPSNS